MNLFFIHLQKNISALCWNCCGNKIMIATGEQCHTQWCNHLNSVLVYSLPE